MKAWASGETPNYGLLLKVLDEDKIGRDLRFFSKSYSDTSKHASIRVLYAPIDGPSDIDDDGVYPIPIDEPCSTC